MASGFVYEQYLITESSEDDPEVWPCLRVNGQRVLWHEVLAHAAANGDELTSLVPIGGGRLLAVFRVTV